MDFDEGSFKRITRSHRKPTQVVQGSGATLLRCISQRRAMPVRFSTGAAHQEPLPRPACKDNRSGEGRPAWNKRLELRVDARDLNDVAELLDGARRTGNTTRREPGSTEWREDSG